MLALEWISRESAVWFAFRKTVTLGKNLECDLFLNHALEVPVVWTLSEENRAIRLSTGDEIRRVGSGTVLDCGGMTVRVYRFRSVAALLAHRVFRRPQIHVHRKRILAATSCLALVLLLASFRLAQAPRPIEQVLTVPSDGTATLCVSSKSRIGIRRENASSPILVRFYLEYDASLKSAQFAGRELILEPRWPGKRFIQLPAAAEPAWLTFLPQDTQACARVRLRNLRLESNALPNCGIPPASGQTASEAIDYLGICGAAEAPVKNPLELKIHWKKVNEQMDELSFQIARARNLRDRSGVWEALQAQRLLLNDALDPRTRVIDRALSRMKPPKD